MLVEWMAANGYDRAYTDEAGNAVGIIGQGARDVVLLGHIDTFGGQPPVRREGRLLYGRGSVDAKGPLCAFAVAAARAALAADMRLIVIGAVEEESATSKGARFAATQFQPRACIIGEPSRWDRITLGYKGRLLVEWKWRGPLAHSAGPVASPAERAVGYWHAVRALAEEFNAGRVGAFEQLDASLRDIHSDQDGAYGEARMLMGFRLPVGLTPDEMIVRLPAADGAEVRTYGAETAFLAEKDTPLSRSLRAAIREQGSEPRFVVKTGTADMNVVGPVWGCPIVAYGPGDASLDHTPDEHLDLDEYLRAIRVLTRVLSSNSLS